MVKILTTMSEASVEMYGMEKPEDFEIECIKKRFTDEEMIKKTKDVDFILLGGGKLNKHIIDNLEGVKLIQTIGVGFNGIDIKAAKERGIYVANAKGVNKVSVSEHAIGLILAALRRTVQADKDIKNFEFQKSYREYHEKGSRTLKSSHVGIIGLGDTGQEVLKRLDAFGSKVSYYSNSRKKDIEEDYGIEYLELEELLKTCDIITIHTPLNKATENMINAETLKLMKKDSILVNTARGKIVDGSDLANALKDGQIGMAALDTIYPEPPSDDHPLLNLPEDIAKNLILTSHIAGETTQDLKDMFANAWENMERVVKGEKPINIVNGL